MGLILIKLRTTFVILNVLFDRRTDIEQLLSKVGKIVFESESMPVSGSWYLYHMVTKSTLRTRER